MYQPRLFREENRGRLHDLIDAWSFGTLVVCARDGEPEISHLPFVLDRDVGAHGDGPGAWRTSMLRPGLRDRMLDEIVGLSIDITALEGKFKLSQNRSAPDQARVVEALRRRAGPDDLALARLMSRD